MATTPDYNAEVKNWYRNALNRDPDAEGLAYWAGEAAKNGGEATYGTFLQSAQSVLGPNAKPITMDYATASKAFAQPNVKANNSIVDDWIRNTGVQNADGGKYDAMIAGGMTPQDAYKAFATEYKVDPATDWFKASQLGPGLVPSAQAPVEPVNYQPGGTTTGSVTQTITPQPVEKATASNWNVGGNQLVQNQLKGLLSDNNPLVQIAKTQGLEAANQRGLLNSSLGAEAGALAHYQYAMPIAQADAGTYAQAGRFNADNQTQVSMANANAQNVRSNLQYSTENQNQQASLNRQHDAGMANLNHGLALERIEAQYKNEFDNLDKQQSFNLRQGYVNAANSAQSAMQQFINTVQASNIPAEAKTEQITQAQNSFNNTIRYLDATYSNMPGWSKEWSLLPAKIG